MNSLESTSVEEEKENKIPFSILQCKSCRNIFGDTSSLEIYNNETSLITLQKKSDDILIGSELETSKEESDYGSTFNNLLCKNCNEVLGRTYRTTTPELDCFRGRFTYNLKNIIMFVISGIEQPQIVASNPASTKTPEATDYIEIVKLQKFVLALYDRLEQIEVENDLLKSEILSLSNKIENFDEGGTFQKQSKMRKLKPTRNETESESRLRFQHQEQPQLTNQNKESQFTLQNQDTQQINFKLKSADSIKILAANISNSDFEFKSALEQNRIISTFDDDSALEAVSWAILSSGRIPQIQKEIDF